MSQTINLSFIYIWYIYIYSSDTWKFDSNKTIKCFKPYHFLTLILFELMFEMFGNSSAKYYQKNKKRLEKGIKIFQKKLVKDTKIFLPEEERNKKRQYGRKHYKNLSEDKKQMLVDYRKKYYKIIKNKTVPQVKAD